MSQSGSAGVGTPSRTAKFDELGVRMWSKLCWMDLLFHPAPNHFSKVSLVPMLLACFVMLMKKTENKTHLAGTGNEAIVHFVLIQSFLCKNGKGKKFVVFSVLSFNQSRPPFVTFMIPKPSK